MASSISTVWSVMVAFTLYQLMIVLPIALIFVEKGMKHPDCTKPDTSKVSGFYGPGTLLALFVTLTSTMLRYEIPLQPLLDSATSYYQMPWEPTKIEYQIIGLDKTLITALGSLIFAEMDLILRTIQKETYGGPLVAALTLTSFAFCISQIGLLSSTTRFWVHRRQGTSRTAAWLLVWVISYIAFLLIIIRLSALEDEIIFVSVITALTTSIYAIVVVGGVMRSPISILLVIPTLWSMTLLLGSPSLTVVEFQQTGERRSSECTAFPGILSLTSTSLKDMDQLAPFVVAFGLCWPDSLFSSVRGFLKRKAHF